MTNCLNSKSNPYNTKYTQRMTVERSEVITYSSPKPTIPVKKADKLKHNTSTQVSQQSQTRKICMNDSSLCQTTFYNDNDDDKFFSMFFVFNNKKKLMNGIIFC